MSICFFASEIANLTGRNRFVAAQDAFKKVMVRHDLAQDDGPTLTCDQLILKKSLKRLIVSTPGQHNQSPHGSALSMLLQVRDGALRSHSTSNAAQVSLSTAISIPCDLQMTLQNAEPSVLHVILDDIKAELHQENGIRVEEKTNLQGSQKKFSLVIGRTLQSQRRVLLFGRIDGIDPLTGHIIELKTRSSRLYRRYWLNEYVQMQCYMYLTKTSTLQFVEKFEDNTFSKMVLFDAQFWELVLVELMVIANDMDKGIML